MDIVDVLIELEDAGFPQVLACEDEVVALSPVPRRIPPELQEGIRINKPELLQMLKKITREDLEQMLESAGGRPA